MVESVPFWVGFDGSSFRFQRSSNCPSGLRVTSSASCGLIALTGAFARCSFQLVTRPTETQTASRKGAAFERPLRRDVLLLTHRGWVGQPSGARKVMPLSRAAIE